MQLLRDASGGCVDIHHGDALQLNVVGACQDYVQTRDWNDGKCFYSIIFFKNY